MSSREKKSPEKKNSSGISEMIQHFKTKPLLYIGTFLILVIIFIAFVFGGIDFTRSRSDQWDWTFGTYNRTPIQLVPNNYFHQTYMDYARMYQISPDDPNYIEYEYWIWRWAFENTVIRTGILDEMKQAGFTVPEAVVDREVASHPIFMENGVFSLARYRAMDRNSQMNLWKQVQEDMTLNYYIMDISNLRISSNEASFVASMASPRRSFNFVSFSPYSYPDSEIAAFALENPSLFNQIHLSVISIYSSEREARDVYNSVLNGTVSFEEAARNLSQDYYADMSGDMGIILANELRWEIMNEQDRITVANLLPGEMSDLVATPFGGWAFFRANQPAISMDIDNLTQLNQVRSYMMENQRGRIEDWLIREAENFTSRARTSGFDTAAWDAGLHLQTFGPIPLNYGDSELFTAIASTGVQELEYAGRNIFFWELAFSTPLNSVSIPRVIEGNVIVLYPFEEIYLDDDEIRSIIDFYPAWLNQSNDFLIRSYFLNNPKLDNQFDQAFGILYWGW